MVKPTCVIDFEQNPMKIYYGGQTLNGRATITVDEEIKVRGVYVKIEGKAYCRWVSRSRRGHTQESKSRAHTGNELYFSEKTYLIGADSTDSSSGEIKIQPGIYKYTFQCNLPLAIPTSFEGLRGYIRYSVLVNFDIPMWPDYKFETPFTVVKILNLNEMSMLSAPATLYLKHNFFKYGCVFFCYVGDDLVINGTIPASGYTPKQSFPISLNVDNKSSKNIECFFIRIIKIIQYTSNDASMRIATIKDRDKVAEIRIDGNPSGSSVTVTGNIVIPVVPPTDTTSSEICKISYELEVTGKTNAICNPDPKVSIPIVIGTIPFRNVMNTADGKPDGNASYPTAPENADEPSAPLLNVMYDIALPSYEEATDQTTNIGGNNYVPIYPIYPE